MTELEKKYEHLIDDLKKMKRAVVAFSGGVDSTFLLQAAQEALGDGVTAVTIVSPYIPKWEVEEARQWTEKLGVKHAFIETDIPEAIRHNPTDRCYLCKKVLFEKIKEYAREIEVEYVLDGTNLDDLSDYRPGLRALSELKVVSPLKDSLLTKTEIRELSKKYGLETWNKPAFACLLTRIPYNTEIRKENLERIEKAEVFMMKRGFPAVRVRTHGDVARIEVPSDQRHKLFDEDLMGRIARGIKEAGFAFAALDLEGYKMGSFRPDEQKDKEGETNG